MSALRTCGAADISPNAKGGIIDDYIALFCVKDCIEKNYLVSCRGCRVNELYHKLEKEMMDGRKS